MIQHWESDGVSNYLIGNKPTFPPKTYFFNLFSNYFLNCVFELFFNCLFELFPGGTTWCLPWTRRSTFSSTSQRQVSWISWFQKLMLVLSDCCLRLLFFPANSYAIFFWDLDWSGLQVPASICLDGSCPVLLQASTFDLFKATIILQPWKFRNSYISSLGSIQITVLPKTMTSRWCV